MQSSHDGFYCIPHLDDTDNQWNFDSDITWTSATRKKQHWKTSPHPKPINNPYSLSAQTKYQRNVTKNDVDIPDHIRIFTMPKHGQKQKQYESFDKRHFLLPHKHINEMEIPGSFIPSAQKRLQQPKHKPGTAHTNKHIKPTENCAFCACKQNNESTNGFLLPMHAQNPKQHLDMTIPNKQIPLTPLILPFTNAKSNPNMAQSLPTDTCSMQQQTHLPLHSMTSNYTRTIPSAKASAMIIIMHV
jgi:hypothetical protein